MKFPLIRRREFLKTSTAAGAGASMGWPMAVRGAEAVAKPAVLGGPPAHPAGFPGWPVVDPSDEKALVGTLQSGQWFRGGGKSVAAFEAAFADLFGAARCVATASGTSALTTALGALDLGPGDEVIIPPYTFVATYNVVVLNYALPIFVDTDRASFQIDAAKIEPAITKQTKAILPVHLGGSPADLDTILEVAGRHSIPVIEDACQAHLAEWRGRPVGTWGLAGCFSFQVSKNLSAGEGGAVTTNDASFADVCFDFHNQGRTRPLTAPNFSHSASRGSNLRLTEFQGSLLLSQLARLADQSRRRSENADYLTQLLREIPGIEPAALYPGVTRSAYHLYMFRFQSDAFAGLSRSQFLAALGREGVPASSGYGRLNSSDYVTNLAHNRHYLKIYGEARMRDWLEQNRQCPQNDQLCAEAVWLTQNMLLGTRQDIEQIADAIRKIQKHAAALAKA